MLNFKLSKVEHQDLLRSVLETLEGRGGAANLLTSKVDPNQAPLRGIVDLVREHLKGMLQLLGIAKATKDQSGILDLDSPLPKAATSSLDSPRELNFWLRLFPLRSLLRNHEKLLRISKDRGLPLLRGAPPSMMW